MSQHGSMLLKCSQYVQIRQIEHLTTNTPVPLWGGVWIFFKRYTSPRPLWGGRDESLSSPTTFQLWAMSPEECFNISMCACLSTTKLIPLQYFCACVQVCLFRIFIRFSFANLTWVKVSSFDIWSCKMFSWAISPWASLYLNASMSVFSNNRLFLEKSLHTT